MTNLEPTAEELESKRIANWLVYMHNRCSTFAPSEAIMACVNHYGDRENLKLMQDLLINICESHKRYAYDLPELAAWWRNKQREQEG